MEDLQLAPPLITSFRISGLNGYRNVALSSPSSVKVVIAENGSGKTTLLNALYAVLTGRFGKLFSIEFDEAQLEFANQEPLVIRKSELFQIAPRDANSDKSLRSLTRYGVSKSEVVELALSLASSIGSDVSEHPVYQRLFRNSPYDHPELMHMLEELAPGTMDSSVVGEIRESVAAAMGEVQTLYLPTYRRIEADMPEFRGGQPNRGIRVRPPEEEMESSDRLIFFGLSDVERRLAELTQQIRRDTLEGYSDLSSRMLDELLSAQQTLHLQGQLDIEAIRLVLARLGKGSSEVESRITELLQTGEIRDEAYRPLAYFLNQLSGLYQRQQPSERAIEAFVKVLNEYWDQALRDKKIEFDKSGVSVRIVNQVTQAIVPFGSLSSGEKQIVSVFARLLLRPTKRYCILIDEPELSLSMDWQRRFLVDVANTSGCRQLIAITHSPFIFDNQLDRFAGTLDVSLKPS